MSAAAVERPTFSPRVMVALIIVAVVAFAGFVAFSIDAPPSMAAGGGLNATSKSAVGYAAAAKLMRRAGVPVRVATRPPRDRRRGTLLILTATAHGGVQGLEKASGDGDASPQAPILVVLPKWETIPDPLRRERVGKGGLLPPAMVQALLPGRDAVQRRTGRAAVRLAIGGGQRRTTAPIDRLQTLSGPSWRPVVTDDSGAGVLVQSTQRRDLFVLAEPDLLNNQGLAQFANAAAALEMIDTLREGRPVVFISTASRSGEGDLLALLLRPPVLGATLCALAAAVLMGLQALVRFGPEAREGRAVAMGAAVWWTTRPGWCAWPARSTCWRRPMPQLVEALAGRAAGVEPGPDRAARLDALAKDAARRNGCRRWRWPPPGRGTRDELLAVAQAAARWRLEMTRERR